MKWRELIYPARCPFCGKAMKREEPCEICRESAIELTGEVCGVCGVLPRDCFCRPLQPFTFERNISSFYYVGGGRTLVLRYKERNRPQLAEFMAKRMFRQIEGRLEGPFSALVPVPNTVPATLRRGYSPTELLGDELSRMLQIPMKQVLLRRGMVQQKNQKSRADRWKNAEKNYALRKGASLSGNVLLVDDIVTTGATLEQCAALLKEAGAEKVFCITFAGPKKGKEKNG